MSDDDVICMPAPWERKREEFARAFRARKACQHTPIRDPRVVENIVSVLNQLPPRER